MCKYSFFLHQSEEMKCKLKTKYAQQLSVFHAGIVKPYAGGEKKLICSTFKVSTKSSADNGIKRAARLIFRRQYQEYLTRGTLCEK